jgi:branched-chain amino acid transport system substrate-binding protein
MLARRRRLPIAVAAGSAVVALGALGVVASESGCSFVLDTSTVQCSTDGDCSSRGGDFAASVCGPEHRCVPQDGGETDAPDISCTTNKECSTALGETALCRKTDHTCAKVLSPECTQTIGDVSNDDALVFGSIFTVRGNSGPAGIERQNSIAVAVNDITQNVGGVPGSDNKPHPLAFVACDDTDDSIKPAKHLALDLGLPAIIGVASSTRVIQVAQTVTVPVGTLLISPTATSTSITQLVDANLVWRTAPSDSLQAVALIDQVSALEAKYRSDNSVAAATKLRMAFVYLNDAYGGGLFQAVSLGASINGAGLTDPANNGLVIASGYDPNPTDLNAQVSAVLNASPRPAIIAAFGSTEVITRLMQPIEAQWGTGSPKPMWLFSDAAKKAELLAQIGADESMRKRVRGSVPTAPLTSTVYKSFTLAYQGMFNSTPDAFGTAGAYDAVYLLAYSAAAASVSPLTGDVLQRGFARLVPPSTEKLAVGGAQMSEGFRVLASGGNFDIDGASGPLDFDLKSGDTRSNIEVWCIARDLTTAPVFVASGRVFDATTNAMAGTFDGTTCQQ